MKSADVVVTLLTSSLGRHVLIQDVSALLADEMVNGNVWLSNNKKELEIGVLEWLRDDRYKILVAMVGSIVVGFGRLKRWHHAKRRHVATIGPIAVLPECWGMGIGTLIVQKCKDLACDQGVKRIDVSFPVDNIAAGKVFSKCGFFIEGICKFGIMRDDGSLSDLCYAAYYF